MAVVLSDGPINCIEKICPNCRYRIGFVPNDIKTTTDSDGDKFYHVKCSQCHKNISLKYNYYSGEYS